MRRGGLGRMGAMAGGKAAPNPKRSYHWGASVKAPGKGVLRMDAVCHASNATPRLGRSVPQRPLVFEFSADGSICDH
jgi:hypothetical protein